jgi:hypothetical protein
MTLTVVSTCWNSIRGFRWCDRLATSACAGGRRRKNQHCAGWVRVGQNGGEKKRGPQINDVFGPMTDVLSMRPAMTQAEADQMAQASLDQKALSLVEGEGLSGTTCGPGHQDCRRGRAFQRPILCDRGCSSLYGAGGYRTHFQVRSNVMNLSTCCRGYRPPAEFQALSWSGHQHPGSGRLGRVKVKFPRSAMLRKATGRVAT